ncbi:MAG: hypothetical protein ACXWBQ_07475 [Usitatibacter sp.]
MKAAAVASRLAALAIAACLASHAFPQGHGPAPGAGRRTDAMRLATLAERVAKLHAQVGQGILPERSRKSLQQALQEFDATLRTVAPYASTPASRENYAVLALLWQDYREWAVRTPSRETARKLRPRSEEVVWIASKGVKMLQEEGRLAPNGGAMRAQGAATLAQRVAKLHLWARWDIRDAPLARELRESSVNLRRAVEALRASPQPSAAIGDELQAAEIQLRFMEDTERALAAGEAPARHIEFIAKTGDHIQESMERVARLYDGTAR